MCSGQAYPSSSYWDGFGDATVEHWQDKRIDRDLIRAVARFI